MWLSVCMTSFWLTLSTVIRIRNAFRKYNRMIDTVVGINGQMPEYIIENLLLFVEMSHDVTIKLKGNVVFLIE